MLPSWFGSTAQSTASSRPTPEQDGEIAEQTLSAYSLTFGATPLVPPMMSATWVPCPWKSIGSGSGFSTSGLFGSVPGQLSPMKS